MLAPSVVNLHAPGRGMAGEVMTARAGALTVGRAATVAAIADAAGLVPAGQDHVVGWSWAGDVPAAVAGAAHLMATAAKAARDSLVAADVAPRDVAAFVLEECPVGFDQFMHALRAGREAWAWGGPYQRVMQSLPWWAKDRPAEAYRDYLATFPNGRDLLGQRLPVAVPHPAMLRHAYVLGRQGCGKSELLKALLHSYVRQPDLGCAVVIDPHGDLSREVAQWREFQGGDRLVYLAPGLKEGLTPTLNPFEGATDAAGREAFADVLVEILEQLVRGEAGAYTANMRALLGACVRVLLERPGSTLFDLARFLRDGANADLLAAGRDHAAYGVAEFFAHDFADDRFRPVKGGVLTRLQQLFNSEAVTRLLCGPSSFDLEGLTADRGRVIVLNLAGGDGALLFGRFVLGRLLGLVFRRAELGQAARVPVHIFVDEAQLFVTDSLRKIATEGRKYGLHLVLAQQNRGEGMGADLARAVFNAEVKFAGRTEGDRRLAEALGVDAEALRRLDVGEFFCRVSGRDALKVRVADHVLGGRNAMDGGAWARVAADQAARFYRPAVVVAPPRYYPPPRLPEPAPEPSMPAARVKGRRPPPNRSGEAPSGPPVAPPASKPTRDRLL